MNLLKVFNNSLYLILGSTILSSNSFADLPTNSIDTPKHICSVQQSTKWYITSAEKNALYQQIFQLSKPILVANKKMVRPNTKCGVILDIDETLLNNSQYGYENDLHCTSFNKESWNKFVNSKVSVALAGASDITHYIHKIGCIVNLVSGRTVETQIATEDNLRREGIYFDQVLLSETKPDGSNKNPRFLAVMNGDTPSKIKIKQTIIAYYGDNVATDFPNSSQEAYLKSDINKNNYNKFGTIYFVLPNPTYGSWEHNKI